MASSPLNFSCSTHFMPALNKVFVSHMSMKFVIIKNFKNTKEWGSFVQNIKIQ